MTSLQSAAFCFVILCSVASSVLVEELGRFLQAKCASTSVTGNLSQSKCSPFLWLKDVLWQEVTREKKEDVCICVFICVCVCKISQTSRRHCLCAADTQLPVSGLHLLSPSVSRLLNGNRHLHLDSHFSIASKYANIQKFIFCLCLTSQFHHCLKIKCEAFFFLYCSYQLC